MKETTLADELLVCACQAKSLFPVPNSDAVERDVDAMFRSFDLYGIRRYYQQRHWEEETSDAKYSDRVEPGLKLESVAAHSWHVCDIVLLLASHFDKLSVERAVMMAVLHDKLEIYTGDWDPLQKNESGIGGHAFCSEARLKKQKEETQALKRYSASINPGAGILHTRLIQEYSSGDTIEARFVSVVDKIQALIFVCAKKGGNISDEQLIFILKYTSLSVQKFPALSAHYKCVVNRILESVSSYRNVSIEELERALFSQLELNLHSERSLTRDRRFEN